MEIKGNAGTHNNFTKINIANVENVNPNVKEVKQVFNVDKRQFTAADRGMVEEIIINLKRVEKDYSIDLTREIGWLRNLVMKGSEQ